MSDLETEKLVGFPDNQEGLSELEWIEKEIEYTNRSMKNWEERGVKVEMDFQYYLNCLGARKKEIENVEF